MKGTFTFITFSGDITQKGYEKKRRKLLLPFMTQQNEPNGHLSQPLPQVTADINVPPKNLDTSANENLPNTSTNGEAFKSPPVAESELILSPSGSKEISERTPSYIPVSQSTPISSASTDVPLETSRSSNEGAGVDASSSDQQENENREAVSTAPPAIPPHKISPNESSNVCSSDNTSASTPCEPSNASKLPEQPVASNENGAIPKPKPNKPRSRNRHKRYYQKIHSFCLTILSKLQKGTNIFILLVDIHIMKSGTIQRLGKKLFSKR